MDHRKYFEPGADVMGASVLVGPPLATKGVPGHPCNHGGSQDIPVIMGGPKGTSVKLVLVHTYIGFKLECGIAH